MTDTRYCGNPDLLMSYLYEDGDIAVRRAFEAHLISCAECAREVGELKAVRRGLAQWTPPETLLDFRIVRGDKPARSWRSWLAVPVLPVWAQLGAAALLVGVAVGISGLEVRYDNQGVTVRTGWQRADTSQPSAAAAVLAAPASALQAGAAAGVSAPWRADLTALEQQLRTEFRPSPAAGQALQASTAPGMSEQEFLRRVRQLVDASETRQQRELALRLSAVVRDMETQRRADMVRVADVFGRVEGRAGAAVAQQRDIMNYLRRVSLEREPR
jgi:hypothetical protein